EIKLAAMACYESELRSYPHPRSLDALRHRAIAWGNQNCMEAAEVFMTVRRIHRHGQTPARRSARAARPGAGGAAPGGGRDRDPSIEPGAGVLPGAPCRQERRGLH